MAQKILGIDLGTNSIGLSLRNVNLADNLKDQLEYFSSEIFKSGIGKDQHGEYSFAAERTKYRQSRGFKETRRRRLWATLHLLIEHKLCPLKIESLHQWETYDKSKGLFRKYPIDDEAFAKWIALDFNYDGKPDYSSPYQLRRELVTKQFDFNNEIDRYKLGRALYHIAQRRGFKSSKGETIALLEKDDIEISGNSDIAQEMKKSESKLSEDIMSYMKEKGCNTVGEAFAYLEDEGVRIRNSRYKAVRSQYKEEIEKIFDFQKGLDTKTDLYISLISNKKDNGTIFYQKGLKSQKGLVGKCTLEPAKPRCSQSHPEYEKFRALSFLNNIKYKTSIEDSWHELSLEIRDKLFNDLFLTRVKTDFPFSEIRIKIEKILNIKLYQDKENRLINFKDNLCVAGCPVTARMIKMLGEDWESWSMNVDKWHTGRKNKSKEKHSVSYNAFDLWHICFSTNDPEFLHEFALTSLGWNEEQAQKLLRLWSSISVGYAMLSLKAIRNINKFLEYGLKYSDAVMLAKIPNIINLDKAGIMQLITDYKEIVKSKVNATKDIFIITNSLIANYKSTIVEHRYADHNTLYKLDESDHKDITKHIIGYYGQKKWEEMDNGRQIMILDKISYYYQQFFSSTKREFYKVPRESDSLLVYLKEKFPEVDIQKWKKLYHPSQIGIYDIDNKTGDRSEWRLGSPNIGAMRNPVARRTLNVLRKKINAMLDDGLISYDDTRIVIETTRGLNDANMRWAIKKYQDERQKENKKIEQILKDYYPKRVINETDIDMTRYALEQSDLDLYEQKKNNFSKDVTRYKLWLEQGCTCLYTDRTIKLTNLFDENAFNIEHTIPRSKSFDSSDKNLTLCDAYYNQHIKKNQIPTSLPNYEKTVIIDGKKYTAIKPRLQKWEDRVERIKKNVEFWKSQSHRAQDKKRKDYCIRQRHLWAMELNYWKDKLSRFKMTEITDGFRNSQLVDTGIITRYATLFLKSIFQNVEVEKGSVTSDFRKMLGIQSIDEKKNREHHSHHAIDATMLTVIPVAAKRDRMLQLFYRIQELERAITYAKSKNTYNSMLYELEGLKTKLENEKRDCHIGKNIGEVVDYIDSNIITNHHVKDQVLTLAHRKVRVRGKILGDKNHPKWHTGDSIRGQICDASYYGAITQYEKDSNGKIIVNNKHPQINPSIKYVIRRELKYKQNPKDTGFTSWEDLEKVIVNKELINMMKSQFDAGTSFKDACDKGIFMLDRHNNKINKIRHIRCYASVTGLKIKEQVYKSNKEYKNYAYAAVGDLYCMCKYSDGVNTSFKIYSLYDISENRKHGLEDIPNYINDEKSNKLELKDTIKPGDMLLLYKDSPNELYKLHNKDHKKLLKRLYKVCSFENDGLRIKLSHHLCATDAKGVAIKDFENLPIIIRCGIRTLKYLKMGKNADFQIKNGKITFNQ